ncbi:MAG: cysteine synthase A [Myxococcales bacterium]|nr:cysteine synthase A [Myxococcales bacterium]
MSRVAGDVLELIGNTPVVRLQKVAPPGTVILGKLESMNPSGSVKDRAARAMIAVAEHDGDLREGSVIVEATSGNTGIALAMIAAVRGYRCVLVMPEDMSMERRRILRAYGAEIVVTSAEEGMMGAVREAERIAEATDGAWMPRQFDNPANPEAHEETTAREIDEAVPDMAVFVAGVGTGGTITGVARALKAKRRELRVVAVEPERSAVLSGGDPGAHAIQGLGAGFVPRVLDRSVLDEVVTVSDVAADKMTRRLAREEGLLVGFSAGANVHAACELARHAPHLGPIVTILCDEGERYLFG